MKCDGCLARLERFSGWWRGLAKVRADEAREIGLDNPAADKHLRIASEYERRAEQLERVQIGARLVA